MSSGLMSCVRENSPPLELDMSASAGPLSLPEVNTSASMLAGVATSTPLSCREEREGAKAETSATNSAEQQKRRRFHPLRNLRRIFRRRTINSAADSSTTAAAAAAAAAGSCSTLPPPVSSASEKNLRSATLSSISTSGGVTASSPSSPLSHQQLQESYQTQSLPKSKSYGTHRDELLSVLLGKKKHKANKNDKPATVTHTHTHETSGIHQQQPDFEDSGDMYSATSTATSSSYHQRFQQNAAPIHATQSRQSLGIAVFPSAMNRSFFAERQKLRSVGDSSQELDSSGNESGAGHLLLASASNGGEMSDSQRSLSEGRLLDSDYTRDALSQSHDSVFSESATASSLSIVLKAELADVLRKRRNRPDASDEDLGLPRSPASPQRRAATGAGSRTAGGTLHNASNATSASTTGGEMSSLSLLSVNSTDGEDSGHVYSARMSTHSSLSMSSDMLRPHHEQHDEVDRVSTERHRLSHSAAKHKMAIRPTKKNVPSRQHRRTLETSIPEANEDILKLSGSQQPAIKMETDLKAKTRSLPPGVKVDQMATTTTTATASTSLRSNTVETNPIAATTSTSNATTTPKKEFANSSYAFSSSSTPSTSNSNASHSFGLRALTTKASALFEHRESSTDDEPLSKPPATQVESNESGFLRRLIQRNSKRSLTKAHNDEHDSDLNQIEPKKLQISTSYLEAVDRQPLLLLDKSRSATSHEQNIEDTRKSIKREINNEGKTGLSAMVNSYGLTRTTSPQREREREREREHQQQPPAAAKPKSGPAARQRYLPQELNASPDSTLVKHASSNKSLNHEEVISVTNLLSRSSRGNDTFQSTTILREINAMTHATNLSVKTGEPTTHFEKKARIVGLSAFQQKLTRSNESVGRNSSSSNSLETSTDEPSPLYYAEKQRKTVEKSRSFRNYEEERDELNGNLSGVGSGMHSNMPSLPDLSLSFRVPVSYYNDLVGLKKDKLTTSTSPLSSPTEKCVSLGFEINDNKLLKPTAAPRAESTGQLTPEKNIIHTSSTVSSKKSTPAKLGAMVPNLSPRNSTNITEIEQNIDLIVKSPFVSVLRKTANSSSDELPNSNSSLSSPTKAPRAASPTKKEAQKLPKERPKVLELKQQTTEVARQQAPTTPSAAVPLRGKSAKAPTNLKQSPTAAGTPKAGQERKSAPATTTSSTQSNAAKAQSFKSSRRSTSVVENGTGHLAATPNVSESNSGSSSSSTEHAAHVPEFMKIQLNRVDHGRLSKGNNLVLAKNIKPGSPMANDEKQAERSYSTDDLSMRHASSDSIEITEREANAGNKQKQQQQKQQPQLSSRHPRSPQPRQGSNFFEAIGKQTRAVSAHSVRRTSVSSTGSAAEAVNSTPKSPVKSLHGVSGFVTTTTTTVTTSPTKSSASSTAATTPTAKSPTIASPVKQQQQQQQQQQPKQTQHSPKSSIKSMEEPPLVVLRAAEAVSTAMKQQQQQNKISLEERRRLFLTEEKTKTDKKIEELRMERKKSITEELYRKSLEESSNHMANGTSSNDSSVSNVTATVKTASVNVESVESANPVVLRKKSFAGAQHANSINGGSNGNMTNHNDPTPELMKVFARRSLKVKDEDILVCVAAATGNVAAHGGSGSANAPKKSTAAQPPALQQSPQVVVAQHQSQSVDSDKENQSASEEKLDRLSKYDSNMESVKLTHASNRISLADFRSGSGLSYVNSNGHNNNNINNNNNNNNNNTSIEHTAGSATIHSNGGSSHTTTKSYLPPIKVGNLRHSQNANSNNTNNNNNHINNHNYISSNNNNNTASAVITQTSNNNKNNNSKLITSTTNERYSLQVKKESALLTATSTGSSPTATPPVAAATPAKSIERSATVGEFKGIHQRRAEWEQRAKEALK